MLLTGVSLIGFVKRQINSFKSRISADSGTFEAESCLNSEITRLRSAGLYDKASLILRPNGYKAGKLYALKPTNGSGDLTFSRASARTRRNASGVIESLANNVPALDYPVAGGCPAWLLEPQRTNLIQNNGSFSGYTYIGGSYASNVFTEDTSTGDHRVSTAFYSGFTGNTLYCFSFLVKKISGSNRGVRINVSDGSTGEVASQFLNLQTGALYGSNITSGNWLTTGLTTGVFPLGNGNYLFYLVAQASALTNALMRISFDDLSGFGVYAGSSATFEVLYPQAEAGVYPTSRIITAGTPVTRLGDYYSLNYGGSTSGGTWFVHLLGNLSLSADSAVSAPYIGTSQSSGTNGWSFTLRQGGGNQRASIWKYENGVGTVLAAPTTDESKMAVSWNGSTANVYINGVKVVTNTSFNQSSLPWLAAGNSIAPGRPINMSSQIIAVEPLSDAECIALTTL